jgi:hypothetical protein
MMQNSNLIEWKIIKPPFKVFTVTFAGTQTDMKLFCFEVH